MDPVACCDACSTLLGAVLLCGGVPDIVAPGCRVVVPRGAAEATATVVDTDDSALQALVDAEDGTPPWLVHLSDVVPLSTAVFSSPGTSHAREDWVGALAPVFTQVAAGAEAALVAGATPGAGAGCLRSRVVVALAVLTAASPEVCRRCCRCSPGPLPAEFVAAAHSPTYVVAASCVFDPLPFFSLLCGAHLLFPC